MLPIRVSRILRALCCGLLSAALFSASPAAAETTSYVYDAAGRLLGALDVSGKAVAYKYDSAGNRTQVSNDPFFSEILPASWTSSSTSGTSGLTTPNGMRDGNFATSSSVHRTNSETSPWIRAHFTAPVYVDNVCVAPSAYAGAGPANVDGAVAEYSTDGGATWLAGGTVSGAAAGVCGTVAVRAIANTVRIRLPGPAQLAAGDIRFRSAGSGPSSGGMVVTDKTLAVPFNTPASVDLTPTGAWTSIAIVGAPATKGVVAIAGALATYTPTTGALGTDTFRYQATGPGGLSNIATVNVTIGQQTAPPTVSDKTLIVNQGGSGTIDLAPQGAWTSVQLVTDPANGQVQPLNGTATLSGSSATYTPTLSSYYGNDRFSFTATGPGGTSAPARVNVQVVPHPPGLSSSYSASYYWNGGGQLYLWPTGVWTTVNIVSPPGKGSAYMASHVLTYTAASNQSYTTTMQVQAVGPGGSSNISTVTITVAPPTAPTAQAKTLNVPANSSAPVTLTALVVQGDVSPTFTISSGPSHGSVSLSGAVATYTPTPGYSGADSFQYTATGLAGAGGPATVSINVTQAPLAVTQTSTSYNRNRLPTRWVVGSPSSVTVTGSGGSGSFSYAWEPSPDSDPATSAVGGCSTGTTWTNSTPLAAIEMWFNSSWRCKVTDNVSGLYAYSDPVIVQIYYAGNQSFMAQPDEAQASDGEPAAESR